MALSVAWTAEEQLVDGCVQQALHAGIEACGSAVLLVPSFAQALDAQRALAQVEGLALAVSVTTPSGWLRERWEVWGDGRTLADSVVLHVLAQKTIAEAPEEARGLIVPSEGMVDLLARLAGLALPWLPLTRDGAVRADVCAAAGLTAAETRLVGLAGALGMRLRAQGYVTQAEVATLVPRLLAEAGAHVPHVVAAGFTQMARPERSLISGLAELTKVALVAPWSDNPAQLQTRALLAELGLEDAPVGQAPEAPRAPRAPELDALLGALFTGAALEPCASTPVELLFAAGPVAEAELVARRAAELVDAWRQEKTGAEDSLIIVTPDMERARRELVPKLQARGVPARLQGSRALLDCPAAQAFFAFAHTVARLVELDATWPEPTQGLEGPLVQLGDMDWWPPRELMDFLLSDISHMTPERAWRLDVAWRGNRLLSPARVLDTLQSERDVSGPVARATQELLRGRVGSAASKLLAPFVAQMGEGAPAAAESDESVAVLQAMLRIAGSLHDLGVTADPLAPESVPLSELLRLCMWAAGGMTVVTRAQTCDVADDEPLVRLMSPGQAAALAPGSARALLVMGCTTAEQPISAGEDLLQALLELLGVEGAPDPMTQARASFAALVAVPRERLLVERALRDAEGEVLYASVMLSELLAAFGIDASAGPGAAGLPNRSWSETKLSQNRAEDGERRAVRCQDNPAPAGRLTSQARELVFVPQDGHDRTSGDKPVLSASQIETYLDCPYKWFSLRRLRLGGVDAGHTGMEMGTFAHRVLEKTHGELLARALGVSADDEAVLRSLGEAHLTDVLSGSRVTEGSLADAQTVLELEFDLNQQHMRMVKRPRQAQQLLIPHNSFEQAQEDQLRDDLLSTLAYQTRILQGFEPRLFEWSFGRHGDLVEYAGVYFTGTVDRIDVSPHGTAVIIDYKHKNPAGFATEYDALQDGVLAGERLPNRVQSLIYAQVVRRAFEGRLRLVGTTYLSTKSPHALAGAADANVADLIFGPLRPARAKRVCVPATEEGSPGMDDLLDRTEELVAEQVAQMLAGNVEARPRDVHSCDFCPVMQCEKRMAR